MKTWQELKDTSDEELIKLYDAEAQPNVFLGLKFYLEELVRRENDRATKQMLELAEKTLKTATDTLAITRIAGAVAVGAFILSLVALAVTLLIR